MKESVFAGEIKKACSFTNCWYYKIPDSYNMERFSPKKPFDSIILYQGKLHAIEFKLIQEKKSFAFSNVKEHQEQGLFDAWNNGAEAYIIINYRFTEKSGERTNSVFVIEIQEYLDLKKKLSETRKSIPYHMFESYDFNTIKRNRMKDGKLHWDIRSFLSHL